MAFAAGTRLGPYAVTALVGVGGMGEVYKATDTRLSRTVAIKTLSPLVASDPELRQRFEREAKAISSLNHPRICTLHDIGSHAGVDFLVMEYLEGETLAQRLAQSALPLEEALRYAIEMTDALEAAHERGIVHRDFKPDNVTLTRDGVKLLDFGIAKLVTRSGVGEGSQPVTAVRTEVTGAAVIGTVNYMSPEQARGMPVDQRTDNWAFGCVLFEMLTGKKAFAGPTAADTTAAILEREPKLEELPAATPAAVRHVLRRCFEKDTKRRLHNIGDARTELEDAVTAIGSTGPEERRPSIAVLPFANMSADPENEYFSDGLAEEIINALTHVPGLKVIARTSAFAFKGKQEDIRRIADTLGVAHVLEGSVRKAGSRIRVTAQLIAAADGSHRWSERYDRELADVFAIQDDISQAIASALQVTLAAGPTKSQHTPKLPAYEAVMKGRHYTFRHTPASLARANEFFEQAMAIDPLYAEAHASLGFSYFASAMSGLRSLRETMPLIRAEAQKALTLDPSDPGPHILLASVAAAYEYDWKLARDLFETGVAGPSTSPE